MPFTTPSKSGGGGAAAGMGNRTSNNSNPPKRNPAVDSRHVPPPQAVMNLSDMKMSLHTDQQTLILNELATAKKKLEEENQVLRDELQDAEIVIRILKNKLHQQQQRNKHCSDGAGGGWFSAGYNNGSSKHIGTLDYRKKDGSRLLLFGGGGGGGVGTSRKKTARKFAFRNPSAPGRKKFERTRRGGSSRDGSSDVTPINKTATFPPGSIEDPYINEGGEGGEEEEKVELQPEEPHPEPHRHHHSHRNHHEVTVEDDGGAAREYAIRAARDQLRSSRSLQQPLRLGNAGNRSDGRRLQNNIAGSNRRTRSTRSGNNTKSTTSVGMGSGGGSGARQPLQKVAESDPIPSSIIDKLARTVISEYTTQKSTDSPTTRSDDDDWYEDIEDEIC